MSIADKITRLAAASSDIKSAIATKGGTVSASDGFEEYAAAIATIPSSPAAGYRLNISIYGTQDDEGYLSINGEAAQPIMEPMPGASWTCGGTFHAPSNGVFTFKLWGFDHRSTGPNTSASWARYKLSTDTTWTNISLSRAESGAVTITLTGDTDLQIGNFTCLLYGTPILMADGSYRAVESLSVGDLIRNKRGEPEPIVRVSNGSDTSFTRYLFSDGTLLSIAHRHRFFNYDLNRFVYLDEWRIGDRAITPTGSTPSLVSINHVQQPCNHASLWTSTTNTYYAHDFLSGNRHSIA